MSVILPGLVIAALACLYGFLSDRAAKNATPEEQANHSASHCLGGCAGCNFMSSCSSRAQAEDKKDAEIAG